MSSDLNRAPALMPAVQHMPQRAAHHRGTIGALPPRVAAVVERWERGETVRQIAAALDRDPRAVARTVSDWDESDHRRRAYAAAQRGSAMLAAAINQIFSFETRERAPAE